MGKYVRRLAPTRHCHPADPDYPYVKCDGCGGEFFEEYVTEFPDAEMRLCQDCARWMDTGKREEEKRHDEQ